MKIMRLGEVMNITGLGRSSIYKLMAEGLFPKSIPLAARSVGWLEQEIDDWILARVAARNRSGARI